MPLRADNDPIDTPGLLAAVAAVATANTQLAAAGGTIYQNSWDAILLQQATFPCAVAESGPQRTARVAKRTWENTAQVRLHLMNRWDQQTQTINQIWLALDLDIRRMKSNLEDDPTLYTSGAAHALRLESIELSPYNGERTGESPFVVVKRMLVATYRLPPYVSAA